MKTLWDNLYKVLCLFLSIFLFWKKKKKATGRSCSVKCVYRLHPFKWKLNKQKKASSCRSIVLVFLYNKCSIKQFINIKYLTQEHSWRTFTSRDFLFPFTQTCWAITADLTPAQNAIDRGTDDMPKTGPSTKANEFKGMSFVLSCLQLSSGNGI